MHHQTMLLWAATRLDGLKDSGHKAATLRSLAALQRSEGGWCLPSLGKWKRRDGKPNDPNSPRDGYAAGLIVSVLQQAGVPADDPGNPARDWLAQHPPTRLGPLDHSVTQ